MPALMLLLPGVMYEKSSVLIFFLAINVEIRAI